MGCGAAASPLKKLVKRFQSDGAGATLLATTLARSAWVAAVRNSRETGSAAIGAG